MVDLKINLPDDFLDEETKCDYYISSSIKGLWAVELDLLNELDRVCKKHNLQYWADSGTLLGAARHKGFIPWDDDIDIFMFREDFDKLCDVSFEFNFPYFFQTEETDPSSLRGHAQIRNSETTGILKEELNMDIHFNQGIFIDIFPLDYLPDDDMECEKYLSRINRYSWWIKFFKGITVHYNFKKNMKGIIKALLRFFCKPFGYKTLMKLYYKREGLMRKYRDTNRVMELCFYPIRITPKLERALFNKTIYLPFEFTTIPVPGEYISILNQKYSNWREIKVKKGYAYHSGIVFDLDKNYKEYLNEKKSV